MKREIKLRWIKALESGRYKQTTGCLKDDSGYCCLGVLCNVLNRGRWDKDDENSYKGQSGGLPSEIKDLCNITNDQESSLVHLNNDDQADFKNIAKWIKKH